MKYSENEIKQKYTNFDFLNIKFILPSTSFYTEEFINKFYVKAEDSNN